MGVLDEVTKELLGRVLNRTGEHKDLYCPQCEGFTNHISVSHARYKGDFFRSRPEKTLVWIAGKLNDINPITNLLGRPYKCTKCGNEILD
jgi:ribosomal protein L44E